MVVCNKAEWKESRDTLYPLRRTRAIFHIHRDFIIGDSPELKEIGIYACNGNSVFGFVVLHKRRTFSYFTKRLFSGARGLRLFPISKKNPIAQLRKAKFEDPWWINPVLRRMQIMKALAMKRKKL
jgi:hypothetical protein